VDPGATVAVTSASSVSGFGIYSATFYDQGSFAGLRQTISDTVGSTYDLSFNLGYGGAGAGDAQVQINGSTVFDTGALFSGLSLQTNYQRSFVGTGSDTIDFLGFSSNSFFAVDDVSVSPAVAATPEPSSFILLSTGILGGLGTLRRRLRS